MGSPPPTRGTRFKRAGSKNSRGITPAYAGNTLTKKLTVSLRCGSPPPTRGTLLQVADNKRNLRITPAYAGNTPTKTGRGCFVWDHPRLRGEHACTDLSSNLVPGSPPPTRGTLTAEGGLWDSSGITPAYAGNTALCISTDNMPQDHPRLRGEHNWNRCQHAYQLGSPPPTRGTPSSIGVGIAFPGITPAYAGNTSWWSNSFILT